MDEKRILSMIDRLNEYVTELEAISPESFEEYMENFETRRACERLLQLAIESIVDISTLLVKELKLGLPKDESNVFDKLRQAGIIDEDTAKKLKLMKGFRNVLVHGYAEIDDKLVFENLKKVDDFKEFINIVLRVLKKSNFDHKN